jgi:hypothetical protein
VRRRLLAAALAGAAACASRGAVIQAQLWPTLEAPGTFPELDDPSLAAPRLAGFRARTDSLGVAFSGGGTRSASATLGQLRALHRLGWIGQVDYIAAVSGGSWASVPYTFRDRGTFPDETFLSLSAYQEPEQLTAAALAAHPPGSLAGAIQDSRLVGGMLMSAARGRGDESWASALSRIFLEPFGLGEPRLFSLNEATRDAVLSASGPGSGLSRADFYLAGDDDPYLLVGGVLLKPHHGARVEREADSVLPFVMTPLYVGVPTRMAAYPQDAFRYGGGYIEAAGYDTYPPDEPPHAGRVTLEIRSERLRFTLADVLGISSSAPQRAITGGASQLTLGAAATVGLPEHHHWSVSTGRSVSERRDVAHGDGGVLDNTGLLSLLSRGARSVLVFHNTNDPIDAGLGSALTPADAGRITEAHLSPDLLRYFRRSEAYPHNQIFGDAELVALYNRFAERATDGSGVLVHCGRYPIPDNPWHDIRAYEADICWVSLNDSPAWRARLPDATDQAALQALRARSGEFVNFPNYRTFNPAGGLGAVDLSAEQVNALATYSTWVVLEAAGELRAGLSAAALP